MIKFLLEHIENIFDLTCQRYLNTILKAWSFNEKLNELDSLKLKTSAMKRHCYNKNNEP